MNKRPLLSYFYLGASILLSAFAQLFLKVAMNSASSPFKFELLFTTVSFFWLLAGLCCYAVSMICWLLLLSKWPLSLAYPMLSLSYVLVYIGAAYWPRLHEQLSLTRSLGLFVVVLGVILVNKSRRTN